MPDRPPPPLAQLPRAGLTILLVLAVLATLALSGTWIAGVSAGPDLQVAFTFTPRVTHVGWTVTPAPTIPGALQPQMSPVPLAPTPVPPPTPTPGSPVSGGDRAIGYDFLEGSYPPTWRIWYNGQELVVSPNDPAGSALLSAFMAQADRAARAAEDILAADRDLDEATAAGAFGAMAAVGGTITAVISCATVPLTFWAAGGTGWTCAGGIVAAVGGGGAVLVSAGQGIRAAGDRDQAFRDQAQAAQEARDLFDAIRASLPP